jgi:hypothetical protein
MKKRATGMAVFLVAAAVLSGVSAFADDNPWVGKWKLNLAKSTYSVGSAPRAMTERFEAIENGLKVTTDATNPQGRKIRTEYTVKFDDKDYPQKSWVDGRFAPGTSTIVIKQLDARTLEVTLKRNGQLVGFIVDELSEDGKARTGTVSGMGGQGQMVNNILVWEKQ